MSQVLYQPTTWPYRLRLLRRFTMKRVAMGERIPRGYRIFMREPHRDVAIAAPIGLHLVFGFARYLWELSYRLMFPQLMADDIEQARWDGRLEGERRERQRADIHCTQASRAQYLEGFNAGRDAMFKQIEAHFDGKSTDA